MEGMLWYTFFFFNLEMVFKFSGEGIKIKECIMFRKDCEILRISSVVLRLRV